MSNLAAHARSMWTERTNWNNFRFPTAADGPAEGDKTYK